MRYCILRLNVFLTFGTGQPLVKASELKTQDIMMPVDSDERSAISTYFPISTTLSLHQRELEETKTYKKHWQKSVADRIVQKGDNNKKQLWSFCKVSQRKMICLDHTILIMNAPSHRIGHCKVIERLGYTIVPRKARRNGRRLPERKGLRKNCRLFLDGQTYQLGSETRYFSGGAIARAMQAAGSHSAAGLLCRK